MPNFDFYFAAVSPWVYLGNAGLIDLLERHDAEIRLHAVDLGQLGEHGFLALAQRPKARQNYRLLELKRWSERLKQPLHLHPRHFPVAAATAGHMVLAAQARHSGRRALVLLGQIGRAVWADELDVSDPEVLVKLADGCGFEGRALLEAAPDMAAAALESTEQARGLGVFGVPWYVVDGEAFWGQDRLDFVDRALSRQHSVR
ncbi:MAG: 2-hydroxychromene-2-carboxylate isomerase [Betaproteobacteria bacterium]|jgi:2-hydroxychromene-2-carboxylate isomerase|nr:2-hydroxychromene-2-carboxylate isomerase [Betaproteobacteria bacterium]